MNQANEVFGILLVLGLVVFAIFYALIPILIYVRLGAILRQLEKLNRNRP